MKSAAPLLAMLVFGIFAVFVDEIDVTIMLAPLVRERIAVDQHRSLQNDEVKNTSDPVPQYSHQDIVNSMKYFHTWYLRMLVWDGKHWSVSSVGNNSTEFIPVYKTSTRLFSIIPFLVFSLETNFRDRFKPGTPPFELLFSEADTLQINCGINNWAPCPSWMPPILSFGSVYKDQSILPSVKAMPAPTKWLKCLMNMKLRHRVPCSPEEHINQDLSYAELKPQVIWRGANWPFLPDVKIFEPYALREVFWRTDLLWFNDTKEQWLKHVEKYTDDLPPRWKAAIWTLEEDQKEHNGTLQWLDSRFVGGLMPEMRDKLMGMGLRVNGNRMDEYEMSAYKYHVDFGGGGGTTWEGTSAKLLAPGLLFHHQTPTKDFFYDELIPWVHYVPIRTNIGDLRDHFEWAETHPEQAEIIAEAGTKFAKRMWSSSYMEEVYQELFVDYLGQVVEAYDPPSGDLVYPPEMFRYQISKCSDGQCRTEIEDKKFHTFRIIKK